MNSSTGCNEPSSGIGTIADFWANQTCRSRSLCGDGHRHERQVDAGWLQDDQTHFVCLFFVQEQREIIERNQRMQMIGEDTNKLGHCVAAGKDLRNALKGVVARKMCRIERGFI
jgi:hypothetical protein